MQFVTVEHWPPAEPYDFRPVLERGNVLFFPQTHFPLREDAKAFLRDVNFAGGAIHKNVAYKPAADKVTGIDTSAEGADKLRSILRGYSQAVVAWTAQLLPQYAHHWKLDYASFRPIEESGRDLPLNKRNDLIHTDAFPTRPTNGDLILRVFTNIHPTRTRNWVTTDPFRVTAGRYARSAGLDSIACSGSSPADRLRTGILMGLKSLGLPAVPRSPYDRFMLHFHEYLKRNEDFQKSCPKYRFDFPPGSTWLTFTDVVPHSVLSGQHALEQTFIIARQSLSDESLAPVSILESLCGKSLLLPDR